MVIIIIMSFTHFRKIYWLLTFAYYDFALAFTFVFTKSSVQLQIQWTPLFRKIKLKEESL
jgi:hypothetical protein